MSQGLVSSVGVGRFGVNGNVGRGVVPGNVGKLGNDGVEGSVLGEGRIGGNNVGNGRSGIPGNMGVSRRRFPAAEALSRPGKNDKATRTMTKLVLVKDLEEAMFK